MSRKAGSSRGRRFRNISTEVDIDRIGPTFGIDFERYHGCCNRFFVYGRAMASFLVGEYNGDYFQNSDGDPVEVDTEWSAGRVVTMLDMELGVGAQFCDGRFRVSGGYMVSAWLNGVATDRWIDAVHSNNFTEMSDVITFDGLTAKAELRF